MKIKHIKTSLYSNHRLSPSDIVESDNFNGTIKIDSNLVFQEIIGFGGAFTEAAAYTLSRMSEEKRNEAINAYFNEEEGLGYSIGRVSIHSCDFSLENYTYVDDYDVELKSFDISRDFKWVIPLIKDAEKVKGKCIKILASPWSPPAWMKDNNDMNHGGKLLDQYKQSWANYYIRFLQEYRKNGLNMWALTVQNEPAAVQIWDSCIYTAEEERDFVRDYLGPTLKISDVNDVKLFVWDHNRDVLVDRVKPIYEDEEASSYVYGTGIHWYVSEEFCNLTKVHDLYPDKHILFTEGCQEGGVHLGSWFTGERYGRNMIGDMNNYCEGYLDWNIVLDETGGPNHVNNLCDAPIIADTKNDVLHYNSSYYYIGQFSKYVIPGSKRVGFVKENTDLLTIAFIRPDKKIVIIIQNETEQDSSITVTYKDYKKNIFIERRSISTFIIEE